MKKISNRPLAASCAVLAADTLAAVEGGFADSRSTHTEDNDTTTTNHENSHNSDSSHSNNDQSYKSDVRDSYNMGNNASGTQGVVIQGPNQIVTTNYFRK